MKNIVIALLFGGDFPQFRKYDDDRWWNGIEFFQKLSEKNLWGVSSPPPPW